MYHSVYFSYSGYAKADACLFAYWNEYDNKTSTGEPDDRLGSVFGSTYGILFEQFYQEKLWKLKFPQQELIDRAERVVDQVLAKETTASKMRPAGVLLWKGEGPGQNPKGMYASRDDLIADVRANIPNGIRAIKYHGMLGSRADAEHKLDFKLGDGTYLAGRADFVIKRLNHKDTIIVDGKGSQHRDKYVKATQLIWYAMLFNLHAKANGGQLLPDRTAFLFWRYPVEESVDWVDVSQDDVDALFEKVMEMVKTVTRLRKSLPKQPTVELARSVFEPKPSKDNCMFCSYKKVCPQGTKFMENNVNNYRKR